MALQCFQCLTGARRMRLRMLDTSSSMTRRSQTRRKACLLDEAICSLQMPCQLLCLHLPGQYRCQASYPLALNQQPTSVIGDMRIWQTGGCNHSKYLARAWETSKRHNVKTGSLEKIIVDKDNNPGPITADLENASVHFHTCLLDSQRRLSSSEVGMMFESCCYGCLRRCRVP